MLRMITFQIKIFKLTLMSGMIRPLKIQRIKDLTLSERIQFSPGEREGTLSDDSDIIVHNSVKDRPSRTSESMIHSC